MYILKPDYGNIDALISFELIWIRYCYFSSYCSCICVCMCDYLSFFAFFSFLQHVFWCFWQWCRNVCVWMYIITSRLYFWLISHLVNTLLVTVARNVHTFDEISRWVWYLIFIPHNSVKLLLFFTLILCQQDST